METLILAFYACGLLLLVAMVAMVVRLAVGAALEHGYKAKGFLIVRDWSDAVFTLSSVVGIIAVMACLIADILIGG